MAKSAYQKYVEFINNWVSKQMDTEKRRDVTYAPPDKEHKNAWLGNIHAMFYLPPADVKINPDYNCNENYYGNIRKLQQCNVSRVAKPYPKESEVEVFPTEYHMEDGKLKLHKYASGDKETWTWLSTDYDKLVTLALQAGFMVTTAVKSPIAPLHILNSEYEVVGIVTPVRTSN